MAKFVELTTWSGKIKVLVNVETVNYFLAIQSEGHTFTELRFSTKDPLYVVEPYHEVKALMRGAK